MKGRYNRTRLKRHDRLEKFKPWRERSRRRQWSHQGRTGTRKRDDE